MSCSLLGLTYNSRSFSSGDGVPHDGSSRVENERHGWRHFLFADVPDGGDLHVQNHLVPAAKYHYNYYGEIIFIGWKKGG